MVYVVDLGNLRGLRFGIVVVSRGKSGLGDLSAEVKLFSVGLCRRVYGLRFLPHREDAVNKAEFIEVLAAHFDGNKSEAARALNAITQMITYQTAGGEKVTITGFGVFEKVSRPARMVRNPRTGERKRAKATAVPRFRAGTDLKAYVSGAKKVPKASKKAVAKSCATGNGSPHHDGSDKDGCGHSASREGHPGQGHQGHPGQGHQGHRGQGSGHQGDHRNGEGDPGKEGQYRENCSRQEGRSDHRRGRQEARQRHDEGSGWEEGRASQGDHGEGRASRRQEATDQGDNHRQGGTGEDEASQEGDR